jgi:hypothetical protein
VFIFSCSEEKETPKPVVEEQGTVEFEFVPLFKGVPYTKGTEITLEGGDKLTINELKFFIDNIRFVTLDTKEYGVSGIEGDSSQVGLYLVDILETNSSATFSNTFKFKTKVGEYADIRMDMKVPSKYNLAEISKNPFPVNQSRGMYWSWNSGFKFFVLNGTSPSVPGGRVHLSLGVDKFCIYNFKSILAAQNPNVPKILVEKDKVTKVKFTFEIDFMFTNTDGSRYRIDPAAVTNGSSISPFQVHGGHYSNVLRGNIQQAIELENFVTQ